jgi:hypothetical protein
MKKGVKLYLKILVFLLLVLVVGFIGMKLFLDRDKVLLSPAEHACLPSFTDTLKEVENAAKEGYDSNTGLWSPHSSVEGGTDTIGYGHKLQQDEINSGKIYNIDYTNGLTDAQIDTVLSKDIETAKFLAIPLVNDKLHAKGSSLNFSSLHSSYQLAFTELMFNVGPTTFQQWNNIYDAVIANNKTAFVKEMRRKMNGAYANGTDNRVAKIAVSLGLVKNRKEALMAFGKTKEEADKFVETYPWCAEGKKECIQNFGEGKVQVDSVLKEGECRRRAFTRAVADVVEKVCGTPDGTAIGNLMVEYSFTKIGGTVHECFVKIKTDTIVCKSGSVHESCLNEALPSEGSELCVIEMESTCTLTKTCGLPIDSEEESGPNGIYHPVGTGGSDGSTGFTFYKREDGKWIFNTKEWFITGIDSGSWVISDSLGEASSAFKGRASFSPSPDEQEYSAVGSATGTATVSIFDVYSATLYGTYEYLEGEGIYSEEGSHNGKKAYEGEEYWIWWDIESGLWILSEDKGNLIFYWSKEGETADGTYSSTRGGDSNLAEGRVTMRIKGPSFFVSGDGKYGVPSTECKDVEAIQYCKRDATNCGNGKSVIKHVKFGQIDEEFLTYWDNRYSDGNYGSTSCGGSSCVICYQDATDKIAGPLTPGETYSLSVTMGSSSSAKVDVWFDWNGNSEFEDCEKYSLDNSGSGVFSKDILIPTHTPLGSTMFRIIPTESSSGDLVKACEYSYSTLDVKDFTVCVGGEEVCDGIDNNGNGAIDEDFDEDGDSYTTCGTRDGGEDIIPTLDCETTEDDPSCDCGDGNRKINPNPQGTWVVRPETNYDCDIKFGCDDPDNEGKFCEYLDEHLTLFTGRCQGNGACEEIPSTQTAVATTPNSGGNQGVFESLLGFVTNGAALNEDGTVVLQGNFQNGGFSLQVTIDY